MASLYGVCWKGLDDLLNRTLPAAGTSGSTRQVWGLLEQDSVYGRLRRFINSLHDMYNKYISTNTINTHYILPCHTGHNRPDGDRRQTHAYPRQRFSRFLPVCMQGTWGWLSSQVCSFPTAWKSITCTHAYDHITWNNKSFEMRWCYKCINDHTKNIMPGFRMLAFRSREGRVHFKLLKYFSSLQKSYFSNINGLTHKIKTAQKVVLNFFSNKSENKLDNIWER